MRNFLYLAAAFALSTAVPETPTADACGGGGSYGYGLSSRAPLTYAVSTHFIPRMQGDRHRAFVALGGSAPTDTKWQLLAPMTYDSTKIAPGPSGAPMTVTLVGAKGSRVITSARYVWLRDSMYMGGTTLALEFDSKAGEDFEVALRGTQADVKWRELPARSSSKVDADWMRARGLGALGDEAVSTYKTGDLETLTIYDEKSHEILTLLRRNNIEISRHLGAPRGIVEVGGSRYIAMAYKRDVSLIAF